MSEGAWEWARRLALAFGMGVIMSLLFLRYAPASLYDVGSNDFVTRDLPMAVLLAGGKDLNMSDAVFAVGFPLIIAAVLKLTGWLGIPLTVGMQALQVVCMGLTVVWIYLLGQLLWGARLAWAGALAWTTYPFVLWLTGQFSTEMAFLVFFLAGMWVLGRSLMLVHQRGFGYFAAGALFGCAMLIRPVVLVIPFLVALILLLRAGETLQKRLQLAALVLFGSLLIIAPWEWFVWSKTERIVLISSGDLPVMLEGMAFDAQGKSYREVVVLEPDVKALMERAKREAAQLKSFSAIAHFFQEEMQTNPSGVVKFFLLKAGRSWYGTDSMRYESLILPIQLFYLACGALGFVQAWRISRGTRELALVFLVMVLYFWAVTILVLPILRYMIPAMGLLIVLLPGAVLWFRQGRWNVAEARQKA